MELFTTPHPWSWPTLSGAGFEGFALCLYGLSWKPRHSGLMKSRSWCLHLRRVIALAKAGNLDALALRDEVVETFKNNPPRKP